MNNIELKSRVEQLRANFLMLPPSHAELESLRSNYSQLHDELMKRDPSERLVVFGELGEGAREELLAMKNYLLGLCLC